MASGTIKYTVACTGWAATVLLTTSAAAQTSSEEIEDIVVTAQKWSESLQDIPGSISAIGGADLESRGVANMAALANQVPALTYGEIDGATFVSIRGVGAAVDNGIAEPSVATYVDGVFLSRSTMGNLNLQDLERIEVLRGPQGTLYGRNATGGAVNFISRAPAAEFGSGMTVGLGNHDKWLASGYVTGPVTESVKLRLSAGAEKRDGFVKNIVGGKSIDDVDRWSARGIVEVTPTADLSFKLSALYQENDSRSAYQQQLTSPTSPLVPPATVSTNAPWRIAADDPYAQHKTTLLLSGTTEWALNEGVSVRSITGYVDHKVNSTFDGDATNYDLVTVEFLRPTETFSQELNVFGETKRFRWLTGAYYFHEKFRAYQLVPLPNGIPGLLPPGTDTIQGLNEKTTAYALFADLTYFITDKLSMNLGLRWNDEEKKFVQTVGADIPGVGFMGSTDAESSVSKSTFLPKIGFKYDVSESVSAYAQYQIGQKSGGQNLGVVDAPFNPEKLKAYEAGIKTRLFEGVATFNVSGFYYDYSDLQVFKVVQGTTSVVENADAEIYGLDIDVAARLGSLRANVGASVLESKYTSFSSIDSYDSTAGLQDLKGNRLTRSPDYTLIAGLEWTVPIRQTAASDLTLRGEVFRSGNYALSAFDTQPGEPQDGYTSFNVSAILGLNEHAQIRGYIDNLTNEKHLVSKLYSPLQGSFLGAYAPPRMYGVELKFDF